MIGPVGALAIAEGGRLLRNPLIWPSLLPTAFWVRATLRNDSGEDRLVLLVGYGIGLTGFVMVAAVVIATLRARLDHTEELLATVAVGPDRRSLGHAGSTLALAAVGGVVTATLLVIFRPADPLGTWDPDGIAIAIPRPSVGQLLQGPLALVTVATFAIALVRWVPTWLVLGPLMFLMMVQLLFLGIFHSVPTDGGRWLAPLDTGIVNGAWRGCGPDDAICHLPVSGYDRVTPWWHAAYLVALAGSFTVVAVLRHRRDRVTWTWFGLTSGVTAVVAAIRFVVAEEFV